MNEQQALKELREKILPKMSSPALEIAVQALEKQIPKTVERHKWQLSKCPCCGTELGEWLEDGYHQDYDHLNICLECGQKLSWSYKELCQICGRDMEEADAVRITKHYHVCKDCYDDMPPEEEQQIIEDYG